MFREEFGFNGDEVAGGELQVAANRSRSERA